MFEKKTFSPTRSGKTDSVSVSRDPSSPFEKYNPRYRRDEIYKVDLSRFRDETDYEADYDAIDELDKLFAVQRQIMFYKDKGFKIVVIDEEDLFMIYAEKIEKGG